MLAAHFLFMLAMFWRLFVWLMTTIRNANQGAPSCTLADLNRVLVDKIAEIEAVKKVTDRITITPP
jgi:hypothetical protein